MMALVRAFGTVHHGFMRNRRFQVDRLEGPIIHVRGDEADHALRVLRLKVDEEVTLFDGRGGEAVGRIVRAGRGEFEVQIDRRKQDAPSNLPVLALAVALPKGNRADWLVEKCAELGVTDLTPLSCERGQVSPGDGKLVRWRRKAVEAAKQSGQAATMRIRAEETVAGILSSPPRDRQVYYGQPRADCPGLIEILSRERPRHALIIIGPEGGFTDGERSQIEAGGGRAVRLAESVLRVETAAVSVAAVWACWRSRAAVGGAD